MTTPIDTLLFYTKLLTGLLLILNIALVVCIRLNLKVLKAKQAEGGELPPEKVKSVTGVLGGLVVAVIVINGVAMFGNYKLLSSAYQVNSNYHMLPMPVIPEPLPAPSGDVASTTQAP